MVLGGEDSVGEIALAGQVDVGEFVLEVQATFHLGVVVFCSAGLHIMAIINLLFIILSLSTSHSLPPHPHISTPSIASSLSLNTPSAAEVSGVGWRGGLLKGRRWEWVWVGWE